MKIVKPLTLGLLHKPYQLEGINYFVVAALGFFRLGAPNQRFLSESLQWPLVIPALPKGQPLDEVMPKRQAEALVLGNAHAPGPPCTELKVQLYLSDAAGKPLINKSLRISGDRSWTSNRFTTRRISRAKPFSSMPLDDQHSFGGPGHPANPVGCGYAGSRSKALFRKKGGVMPNIESASQPNVRSWQALAPAGLGPQNVAHFPRNKKFGTYDQAWLNQDAPGFARDIDWSVFNLAREDQWSAGYFQGGENYCLSNLHPRLALIQGQLPSFRARAFILQQQQSVPTEIVMLMDTVWFLPEQELGIAIYHGQTTIADSDALDVSALMVAYEHSHAPKSLAHYQEVMALRLAPETAALHVFNESQLAADYTPEQRAIRNAAQLQAEQQENAKRQQQLDLMDAQFWIDQGATPPPDHTVPRAQPSPFGLVTTKLVTEGDFDLAATLAKANAMASETERQGKAAMAQLAQQELAVPPAQSLAEVIERGAIPAYDLMPAEETGTDPATAQLLEALALAFAQGGFADSVAYAAAQSAARALPAQKRQARRAAPTVTPTGLPLLAEVALQFGAQIRQWQTSGCCLAGRDFAGANLAGVDFSGMDLREILLENADLSGASFIGANLQGAVLTGAKLDQADFSLANLSDANLSGSSGTAICFQQTVLRRAQAISASWPQANLQAANFDDAIACKINLCGAQLSEASINRSLLLEARADDSLWLRATLNQTVLLRASLQRADFSAARLTKTVLIEAQLQNSRWTDARWMKLQATGSKTNWSGANLAGINALECGLHGAVLTGVDLRGAQCLRCDFGQCNMQGATLDDGVFSCSLFLQTSLREASLQRADFYQALCRKTDFCGANLEAASFAQCELSGATGIENRRAA